MAIRSAHGRKKSLGDVTAIEVLPFDELPGGVPAFSAPLDSVEAKRLRDLIVATKARLAELKQQGARISKGESATLMGKLGGYGRALGVEMRRLQGVQLGELARLAEEALPGLDISDPEVKAALPLALEFITQEVAGLKRDVGGGHLPNGPMSFVVSGALILLSARVLFARGDYVQHAALAEKSAAMLSRAHEYAAKRAQTRPRSTPTANAVARLTGGSNAGNG